MSLKKTDHREIYRHISYLKSQSYLTDAQKFWPENLFHFTDIKNAVKILSDGFLFPRNQLEKTGGLETDIAGPDIISATPPRWKDFVRLYFRPRTPFQYVIEGIRPEGKLPYEAHCPIPIFFIFDAREILSLQSTHFSNGNLRSTNVEVDDKVNFYLSLPFEKIYHDVGIGQLGESEQKSIKFHRHAEILIPEKLDLSGLKYIFCRSQAEFEMLVQLLPDTVQRKWKNRIAVDKRLMLFYSNWSFVEKVNLSSSSVHFTFNQPQEDQKFKARLEIREITTGKLYFLEKEDFEVVRILSFELSKVAHPEYFQISFWLDDTLAYQNIYIDESDIF